MSQSTTFKINDKVNWWSSESMTGTVIDIRKRLFRKPEILVLWDDSPEKPTWHPISHPIMVMV